MVYSFLSCQKTDAVFENVEAQAGFEPTHGGFADRRVTTSPLRHNLMQLRLSLVFAGSSVPATARPRTSLHDPKRCLCAPVSRDLRIPIPKLRRVEPRALSEGKDRPHWRLKSMETAAAWWGWVETPPAPAGSYPRPSTTEAQPEELRPHGWNRCSRRPIQQ